MALPDTFVYSQDTAIVWGHPGGSGVTHDLSLNNLADTAGRMGVAVDLGADFHQHYSLYVWVETGTAPAAGLVVECYLAFSHDNLNWPGKVTGLDAAYAPGAVAATKRQLGSPSGFFVATADGSIPQRQAPDRIIPFARYVCPVVINLLGVAFRNETTPQDNDSRVILVPILGKAKD